MLASKSNRIKLLSDTFCRCFSLLDRFRVKNTIQIEKIKKEKYLEAVRFMQRNYLDDPFLRAIGIFYRHRETRNFLTALWTVLLKSDMSLAAVYRKQIRGLSINSPHSYRGGDITNDTFRQLARIVETDATRSLLLAWDKINTEVSRAETKRNGGIIHAMELAGLAVDSQFRRQGIGKHLIQCSANMARQLGYEYIRIDCTNLATSRLCERLGWKKVWESPIQMFHGYLPDVYGFSEKETEKVKVFLQPVTPVSVQK